MQAAPAPAPAHLALYYYDGCFFCHRVRHELERLGATVELRNIFEDDASREELVQATGRRRVPVLRIEHADGAVEWMPESRDIIAYLRALHEANPA